MIPEAFRLYLATLLARHESGISVDAFSEYFKRHSKSRIKFELHGYRNLVELFEDVTDICRVEKNLKKNKVMLYPTHEAFVRSKGQRKAPKPASPPVIPRAPLAAPSRPAAPGPAAGQRLLNVKVRQTEFGQTIVVKIQDQHYVPTCSLAQMAGFDSDLTLKILKEDGLEFKQIVHLHDDKQGHEETRSRIASFCPLAWDKTTKTVRKTLSLVPLKSLNFVVSSLSSERPPSLAARKLMILDCFKPEPSRKPLVGCGLNVPKPEEASEPGNELKLEVASKPEEASKLERAPKLDETLKLEEAPKFEEASTPNAGVLNSENPELISDQDISSLTKILDLSDSPAYSGAEAPSLRSDSAFCTAENHSFSPSSFRTTLELSSFASSVAESPTGSPTSNPLLAEAGTSASTPSLAESLNSTPRQRKTPSPFSSTPSPEFVPAGSPVEVLPLGFGSVDFNYENRNSAPRDPIVAEEEDLKLGPRSDSSESKHPLRREPLCFQDSVPRGQGRCLH